LETPDQKFGLKALGDARGYSLPEELEYSLGAGLHIQFLVNAVNPISDIAHAHAADARAMFPQFPDGRLTVRMSAHAKIPSAFLGVRQGYLVSDRDPRQWRQLS
jgi:hypothetical protein